MKINIGVLGIITLSITTLSITSILSITKLC